MTISLSLCNKEACINICVGFESIDVLSCMCSSLPQVLVHHGLFPTAPSQPRMAVSVDLLSFYRTLFEHSCDAINALASALKTHYSRRGFQIMDAQVNFNYVFKLLLTHFGRMDLSRTHFAEALAMLSNGSTYCKSKLTNNLRPFSNKAGTAL